MKAPVPKGRGEGRLASRAVQATFVLGLAATWYVATNYGGISSILLPNPVAVYHELVDVLSTGEFVEDLRVTLTELLVAFSISSTLGVTLAGVAFAVLLSFSQLGCLGSVHQTARLLFDRLDFDLLLTSREYLNLNAPDGFPRLRLSQAASVAAVATSLCARARPARLRRCRSHRPPSRAYPPPRCPSAAAADGP